MGNKENLSIELLPNEEWRDIVGYEGLYQVSNLGRVKSLERGHKTLSAYIQKDKILKTHIGIRGYCIVCLSKNGKVKHIPIHRLMAKAFIQNPKNKPCIDHINTIRTDNRIENLRWCTHKENSNNVLSLKKNAENCKRMWEMGYFDNRNNLHYQKVAKLDLDGNILEIFDSIKEASIACGICASSISAICLNTNPKRHTAGGFKWKHIGNYYMKQTK